MAEAHRPALVPKTSQILENICNRIADGESLRQICGCKGMPPRRTVLGWLEADENFSAKYARARTHQGDFMDDKILEVADNSTPATALADRVKIAAYQWRASKLRPKVYGEAILQKHANADGDGPPEIIMVNRGNRPNVASP